MFGTDTPTRTSGDLPNVHENAEPLIRLENLEKFYESRAGRSIFPAHGSCGKARGMNGFVCITTERTNFLCRS